MVIIGIFVTVILGISLCALGFALNISSKLTGETSTKALGYLFFLLGLFVVTFTFYSNFQLIS